MNNKYIHIFVSAMTAFTMFTSTALAADSAAGPAAPVNAGSGGRTSADYKDLADTDAALRAKIDALLKAGVLEGTGPDTFGIGENLTRGQFAKVLVGIYGVPVDHTLTASSFSDVLPEDPANGWALPYIEAAKKAGLVNGKSDTLFDPGAPLTLGEIAAALLRGIGITPDMQGTPWYQDAIRQAAGQRLLPEGADGARTATRADLVVGAYGGRQAYAAAKVTEPVSVASVKAIGVRKVQVDFDREVDTEKATLTLIQGTAALAAEAKFAEDKKSAVLTLSDVNLRSGEYKVTLGGLDASSIGTNSGTFTAEDESVKTLEFVHTGDTVAQSSHVTVKLKATNQYDELATIPAGNYSTYGDIVKLARSADGYLLATLDSSGAVSGAGVVTASVVNQDSRVSADASWKVGTSPFLTKVELGAVQYGDGRAIQTAGDHAKFGLAFYDQYGSQMDYDAVTELDATPALRWKDDLEGLTYEMEEDGDGLPILDITLTRNVDKGGEFRFTFMNQAAAAEGSVLIKPGKLAAKVELGEPADVIAAGDLAAYIPFTAYDAQGQKLSTDDILSTENLKQIHISSNDSSAAIATAGEHRGKIKIGSVPARKNGSVTVSVLVASANSTSSDSKTFQVQPARVPDRIKEVTAPLKGMVPGATTVFTYVVLDQYGKQLDRLIGVDDQGNAVASGGSTYQVQMAAKTYGPASSTPDSVTGDLTSAAPETAGTPLSTEHPVLVIGDKEAALGNRALIGGEPTVLTNLRNQINNKKFRFAALNHTGAVDYRMELEITILKDQAEVSTLKRSINVMDPSTANLTYSLNSIPALRNTIDSGSVFDSVYNSVTDATYTFTKDSQLRADSKFGRGVAYTAKNAAGDAIAMRPKQIVSVASSDQNVVNTFANGAGSGYVIGNKAGTAKVSVSFIAADGSTKSLSTTVTVKADPLRIDKLTWDDREYNEGFSFNAFTGLNMTDNYGILYENAEAQKYNPVLGAAFSISGISDDSHSILIDAYGNVRITGPGPVSFDLTVTSAAGVSATVTIYASPETTVRTAR
ncbi:MULTISPECIES: S-layer homology domain-containing protein [Paenibacillus]|uniref:S-layer homology domain-containing protein n=1 Tax=Paenibacillus TaxID=44249 RepID=UPI0022B8E8AD|nr:S-layer homology domain-containing protein [Paenibacillus caseinilyticus]MCZ8519576.1 S-layer homology domain-containing protein [Paenibacillus caseinilyticus]